MVNKWLVAVPLLALLGNPANAAENPELLSQNARIEYSAPKFAVETPEKRSSKTKKILKILATIGADNSEVRNIVNTVDSRVDEGYFRLNQQSLPSSSGTLTLRYRLSDNVDPLIERNSSHGLQRMELHYTPDKDSRWQVTASKEHIALNYRIPLDSLQLR